MQNETNPKPQPILQTPAAEVEIDEPLIRRLLASQHPDLAGLPLEPLASGWDNSMYRLGGEFTVRLPRRKLGAKLIEHEQEWLPRLPTNLPIPIPVPIRIGKAEFEYPWSWSIMPWLKGKAADLDAPAPHQAPKLARFLRALHQPAPKDAPVNNFRGIPLAQRAEGLAERFDRLRQKTRLITPAIDQTWKLALAAPLHTEVCWIHGDFHARNVLVKDGVITGVIDWGDMTSGDVATDLASIWMLLGNAQARQEALTLYDPSPALLARAKGWAIFFGVILLDTGLIDTPRHATMGQLTLERLAEDGE